MTRLDWLVVAFKSVGLVFGILGLAGLVNSLLALMLINSQATNPKGIAWIVVVEPAIYLVVGYALLFSTERCVSLCGEPTPFRRVGE